MYSVTVTPGRSSEKQSTSRNKETELVGYKSRRRESVPVRVLNYIRSQFQAEGISVNKRITQNFLTR
ncbi:Kv channel-interacting protein 1-like isoform X1 [Vespula maculifrons]|uniref:Kv channel-interacting protein 1-like isoform X1 n=1 Tax=Vespula maculifrons TaxID=7453 RepID=A0ABD2CAS9_VESMC